MNPATSRKLDLLRFLAAMLVVVTHTNQQAYTGSGSGLLEPLGRLGVIIFFVLSGYVIAYVSESLHHDFRDFMIARFARLHSVLLPALAVTYLADLVGSSMAPALYAKFPSAREGRALVTFPAFVLFMNQSLGHAEAGMRWLSNSPLWSIAYEFWYYVLFGAIAYLRGVLRVLTFGVAAFLCGSNVLLLWPLWLVGVILYKSRDWISRARPIVVLSGGLAGVAGLILLCSPVSLDLYVGLRDLGRSLIGPNYSGSLPWDLVLIPLISLVMLATIHPDVLASLGKGSRLLPWLAGGTFSIYSFHLPLLMLSRASGAYETASVWQTILVFFGVVGACLMLSIGTERRKRPWRRLWGRILGGKIVHE